MAITVQGILDYGAQNGYSPEDTAAALQQHRASYLTKAESDFGSSDPDTFYKGQVAMDQKLFGPALQKLQGQVLDAKLHEAYADPAVVNQVKTDMRQGYVNPDLPSWEPIVKEVAANDIYQLPGLRTKTLGRRITAGPDQTTSDGTVLPAPTLASYTLNRKGADDVAYLRLTQESGEARDKQTHVFKLPKFTQEDVKAEIQKSQTEADRLVVNQSQIMSGLGDNMDPSATMQMDADATLQKSAEQRIQALQEGGVAYLAHEKIIAQAKANPKLKSAIGDDSFWDRVGWGGLQTLAGINRAMGPAALHMSEFFGKFDYDQATHQDRMAAIEESRAAGYNLPSLEALHASSTASTNKKFNGGLWNDILIGAEENIPQMALVLLGGAGATSAGLKAGSLAWEAAATAPMSVSAGGNKYAQNLQEANSIEATDPARAAKMRQHALANAVATGVIEGGSELLFPTVGHAVSQGFKGGFKAIVKNSAKSGGKEALEELPAQVAENLLDNATLGANNAALDGTLTAMGAGGLAGLAMSGAGHVSAPAKQYLANKASNIFDAWKQSKLDQWKIPEQGVPLSNPGFPAHVNVQRTAEEQAKLDALTAEVHAFHTAQGATTNDPANPTPEALSSVARQHQLTVEGKRAATLLPGFTVSQVPASLLSQPALDDEGHAVPAPEIKAIDTPDGALLYNSALVDEETVKQTISENKLGTLLGYATEDRPAAPDRAITILNQHGAPVLSVEADEATAPAQLAALTKLATDTDTVITETRESALTRRAQEHTTEAALAHPNAPRTMLDVAQRAGKQDRLQFSRRSDAKPRNNVAPTTDAPILPDASNQRATSPLGQDPRGTQWEDSNRNPRRALESIAQIHAGGASSPVGSSSNGERGLSSPEGAGLPQIDGARLLAAHAGTHLTSGEEHDVYLDAPNNRVIKLTKPGQYGAPGRGGLRGYISQMAEINSKFGDQQAIEGWTQLPGETAPRLVITQPNYQGRASTDAEINNYMRRKGYDHVFDGAWLNSDGLLVTDTFPRNFVTTHDGIAHPIDIILSRPKGATLERYEHMANSQPQPAPAPDPVKPKAATTPLNQKVKSPVAIVNQAIRHLEANLPGIVGTKTVVVANPTELLQTSYANENSFTPEEIADMQDAEAFYDNLTGHTIIFTDQIEVRPGESERAAVARVILHERVGHNGMNAILVDDASQKTWERLTSQIPTAELENLRANGYAQLTDEELKLEWFARQIDQRTPAEIAKMGGTVAKIWDYFRGLYARAFKGFSASLQTTLDLRALIRQATAATRNGTAIPVTAHGLSQRIQFSTWVKHQEGTPFTVKNLLLRQFLTGSPLPKSFHEISLNSANERQAIHASFARTASMLERGAKQAAKKSGLPITTIYQHVNNALEGTPGSIATLSTLDEALAEATRLGRNMIDDLSMVIARTLPSGSLQNAIVSNQGSWMRRSYAAFDASANWTYENLRKAAESGSPYNGQDVRTIMQSAANYLVAQPKSNRQGQIDRNGLPKPGSELESDFIDLLNRDTWGNALVPNSASARKNVTSLQQRADIAPEIRALMGEHTNPITKFTASASFQAQFVAKHHSLTAMRTIGLATGLFTTQRGGKFTEALPTDNPAWSPLAGLYTTKALWSALQNATTAVPPKAWKLFKALTANAKLNNVALNPKSLVPNILGGFVSAIQAGDIWAPHLFDRVAKAAAAVQSGKARASELVDATTIGLRDATAALRTELIAAGVLDSNITLRDFQEGNAAALLELFPADPKLQKLGNHALGALHGAAIGNALGRIGGAAGQGIGIAIGSTAGAALGGKRIIDVNHVIAEFTQSRPDAFFKILGYLNQLRLAHLTGQANPHQWAANRTKNLYPTYERVVAPLRALSLTPLIGSFVSFAAEVPRNLAWNIRYASQDIRSSNPHLIADAARRLAGVAAITAISFALPSLGMLFGYSPPDDDKKKKFMKWFAADYEKGKSLTFTRLDEDGVSYFNHSYIVPQAALADIIKATATDAVDDNIGTAAINSVKRVMDYFGVGQNMIQSAIEGYSNRDHFDRALTNEDGVKGTLAKLDHVAETYTDPGYAKSATKIARTQLVLDDPNATPAAKKTAQENQDKELSSLMGKRSFVRSWDTLTKSTYYNFQRDIRTVRDNLHRDLDPKNRTLTTDPTASLDKANTALSKIQTDLQQFESDAQALGIPKDTLAKSRKDASFPASIHQMELTPEGKAQAKKEK